MTNLLESTLKTLESKGKTPDDVRWVGSRDGRYAISWNEFLMIADTNFDSGYGSQEIAADLVVVGDGWWLERREYDGSEWWVFCTAPVRLEDANPFKIVNVKDAGEVGWKLVEDLNQ